MQSNASLRPIQKMVECDFRVEIGATQLLCELTRANLTLTSLQPSSQNRCPVFSWSTLQQVARMCSKRVCRRDVVFEILTQIPLRLTFLSNICHSLVCVPPSSS